jgi:peptide/nickel transport system ATP-binding protein
MLKIKDLNISVQQKKLIPLVNNLELYVKKSQIVALVGESGCGKSITARSILKLLPPPLKITSGSITLNDINILSLSEKKMQSIRGNQISMIFQDPLTSLNPLLKIKTQLSETIHQHLNYPPQKRIALCYDLLHKVKIKDPNRCMNSYPHELSGGMIQRIMIAMALCCKPQFILADEPTTALDVTTQYEILLLIEKLKKTYDLGILLITHDLGVVAEFCDYVYVMYAGNIVEHATTKAIFTEAKHPYTQALLNANINLTTPSKQLSYIKGSVPTPEQIQKNSCTFYPRCIKRLAHCNSTTPPLRSLSSKHRYLCHL